MPNFYLRCEDLAVGFVGPFPTTAAAEEHIKFLEARGDADPGKVVTEEEVLTEDNPFILTPEQDRAYKF